MKDQKVTTTQDAQALIGVAIAGDPHLESAVEVLFEQAERKSKGRENGFKSELEGLGIMDNILTVNEERMVKANARRHRERCEFAEGKTIREVADSQYYNWADLGYDIKTMRYLTIVDGPNYDPNAVEEQSLESGGPRPP